MGTRFELLLIGEGDAARLRAAGEEALDEIRRWHDLLSLFDKASVISRVNREAAERLVPVSPEVAQLLRWCQQATATTQGAFDIAVGHLMRQAGFRDQQADDTPFRTATVRERTDAPALTITPDNRITLTPGAALDLGAIGKGWALDRAADILREHLAPSGLHAALLHGGTSSITAIRGPWRIALDPHATIHLTDESLGLSAPSGRQVSDQSGHIRGHILDPRTGQSADALTAAAVTGPSAALCDAWSTALIVNPALAQAPEWPIGYLAHLNTGNGFHQPPQPVQPSLPHLSRVPVQGTHA
ncbi:MAG: FAD:protein FMN transferase [Phycisphaerales bacterium]